MSIPPVDLADLQVIHIDLSPEIQPAGPVDEDGLANQQVAVDLGEHSFTEEVITDELEPGYPNYQADDKKGFEEELEFKEQNARARLLSVMHEPDMPDVSANPHPSEQEGSILQGFIHSFYFKINKMWARKASQKERHEARELAQEILKIAFKNPSQAIELLNSNQILLASGEFDTLCQDNYFKKTFGGKTETHTILSEFFQEVEKMRKFCSTKSFDEVLDYCLVKAQESWDESVILREKHGSSNHPDVSDKFELFLSFLETLKGNIQYMTDVTVLKDCGRWFPKAKGQNEISKRYAAVLGVELELIKKGLFFPEIGESEELAQTAVEIFSLNFGSLIDASNIREFCDQLIHICEKHPHWSLSDWIIEPFRNYQYQVPPDRLSVLKGMQIEELTAALQANLESAESKRLIFKMIKKMVGSEFFQESEIEKIIQQVAPEFLEQYQGELVNVNASS